jgi:hypothetical protein
MHMKALNRYRACRCRRALRGYDTDEDMATCLIDFLADARHWCERAGESYAKLDRKAFAHYRAERIAAGKEGA